MKKRPKSNMHAKFGACMTIWKIVSFIWPTILGCHEKDCLIKKGFKHVTRVNYKPANSVLWNDQCRQFRETIYIRQ